MCIINFLLDFLPTSWQTESLEGCRRRLTNAKSCTGARARAPMPAEFATIKHVDFELRELFSRSLVTVFIFDPLVKKR